jgi:pheromone shutdown protein TraB
MKNSQHIIIIGTLHADFVSKNEIEDILDTYKPRQVLVELTEKEVKDPASAFMPRKEMFYAIEWCRQHDVAWDFFDEDINVLADGVNGKEEGFEKISQKFGEELKQHTWKDLNQATFWTDDSQLRKIEKELDVYMSEERGSQREAEMIKNIQEKLIKAGTVVVFTGLGHLSLFEKEFPEAEFPFR